MGARRGEASELPVGPGGEERVASAACFSGPATCSYVALRGRRPLTPARARWSPCCRPA